MLAPRARSIARNYTEDEGRPLGVILQGRAPSHRKRLWPKAMVVSICGKGFIKESGGDEEDERKQTTADASKAYTRRHRNQGWHPILGSARGRSCLLPERCPA